MATKGRKDDSQSNGKSKGGIRFRYMDSERLVDFTVDNDDANVTDGLRLIANALAGRNIAAVPAPKLLKKTAGSAEVLEKDEEETLEQPLPFPAPESVDEQEQDEETEFTETVPKKPRRVKAPKVPTDINLSTAKVPLADFMAQKGNPTEMMDRYSVVAVWYKQEFNITEITIDRIFAAFKHLGLESKLPVDVEKPLKNLTYNKQWFQKSKAPGAYELIWTGEDAVIKMGTAKQP